MKIDTARTIDKLGVEYFINDYVVHSDSRIWSNKTSKYLKPINARNGYKKVCLHKNGYRIDAAVHRLVALVHIKNIYDKPEVNHKNGNKADNRASNLEWVTKKENFEHAKAHGLTLKGEKNNKAKITRKEVIEIRELASTGDYLHREIAAMYNISSPNCSHIIRGYTWKHI